LAGHATMTKIATKRNRVDPYKITTTIMSQDANITNLDQAMSATQKDIMTTSSENAPTAGIPDAGMGPKSATGRHLLIKKERDEAQPRIDMNNRESNRELSSHQDPTPLGALRTEPGMIEHRLGATTSEDTCRKLPTATKDTIANEKAVVTFWNCAGGLINKLHFFETINK